MNRWILTATGTDKTDTDSNNNIIFTIKQTNFYFFVVSLSAEDNQKLSKFLGKKLEKSVYWNGYQNKT